MRTSARSAGFRNTCRTSRSPHAGSVVIQSLPRTTLTDAEYHGVYAIRGAKIRPNTFVEAWPFDPKMDLIQHYTSVVYVTGASHHEGSETPSQHEMQLDIIYTINYSCMSKLTRTSCSRLWAPNRVQVSTANDVPKESKVVDLTNRTEKLDLTQVRDRRWRSICFRSGLPSSQGAIWLDDSADRGADDRASK